MEIRIQYCDESIVELISVESIRLVSIGPALLVGSMFEIKCFGNNGVIHKHVINLEIITW